MEELDLRGERLNYKRSPAELSLDASIALWI